MGNFIHSFTPGKDTDEKQNLGYYYPDANDDIRLLHCY